MTTHEMHHASTGMAPSTEAVPSTTEAVPFSTDPAGLPERITTQVVDLADGDTFELRITPVSGQLQNRPVRLLAYNGSVPGPTLRVRQGSEVIVDVTNDADYETTVHWHGLRLDNRFDGTHHTQAPIPVGGSYTYRLTFPDPGFYWYHPHIREDYGQEMGLYGTIVVEPAEPDYWPPVHREIALTLDDIELAEGSVAAFSTSGITHTAMGRFGDVFLVAGDPDLNLTAQSGEVVRMYLVNTANTRVFNVALPGATMKLVGGDSGRYEREEIVDSVLLAPSERAVVDVLFGESGQRRLEHRTPDRVYRLADVTVTDEMATPALDPGFAELRNNADMVAERDRVARYLDSEPDKTLAFIAHMDTGDAEGATSYGCPMHPEITSAEPGRCPLCGMKLLPAHQLGAHAHAHDHDHSHRHSGLGDQHDHAEQHDHADHHGHTEQHDQGGEHNHPGHDPAARPVAEDAHQHHAESETEHHHAHTEHHDPMPGDGIEWEDDMPEINRQSTPENMRWIIVDRGTGGENHAIDWRFRVGDQVKIRLVNEMDSDHPMHHPFHVHGAGRFLILSRDGVPEANLVWKDTVLVRRGETVDILLDVSNPGTWMAHCHIAEHHESGMMFNFHVDPQGQDR